MLDVATLLIASAAAAVVDVTFADIPSVPDPASECSRRLILLDAVMLTAQGIDGTTAMPIVNRSN